VVDSGCDVPLQLVEKYPIHVFPLYINMNGTSHADDGVTFDRMGYYQDLATLTPLPKTSAPSVRDVRDAIEGALAQSDHVVCISIASGLSNTYNVMRIAAEEFPDSRITLWDSTQLSMGGGWQVVSAAEAAAAGATVGDIRALLHSVRSRTVVYAALVNLDFLRRGGRIGWTKATVGNLLRIRPIVRVLDGTVKSAAQLRTRRAWIKRVADFAREQAPLERIALLHTGDVEAVEELAAQLSDTLPPTTVTCVASPVIGTHTGPDGIGIATVRQNGIE
jgi:DegV family protein with EDD domain